jgi:polyribonucleotide nucleotidyltransferase
MLRVYCRARAGVLPLHSLTRSLTRSLTQNITSNVLLSPPLTQTPNPSPVPHFNTSVMAHLAQGSIFCSHGNTAVHVAVCSKLPTSATSAGDSFLPLTVDYKNKFSSLGKIPMNTNRRERHGTDDEILASRVIDRSIRPLFPKSFRNDTQITTTSHAVDGVSDPIVLGVNAASCALLQAGLPWHGPVGCVRVGCIDGKLVANPSIADMASSTLDLLYTGTEYRTIM